MALCLSLSRAYEVARAIGVMRELAGRAAPAAALKEDLLAAARPYGLPALRVPKDVALGIDRLAAALERANPTRRPATDDVRALDGRWRVVYSDAPPPSNGALGPFRGDAFQIVDADARTYVNELLLGGGAIKICLAASFEPRGPDALRVRFETLTFSIFGSALPAVAFPAGTERTWLLTYTDDDIRIVRAGLDGGRSTVRDLGLVDANEGAAADAYLFVLSRAPEVIAAPRAPSQIAATLEAPGKRRMLKERIRVAAAGSSLGADSSASQRKEMEALMDQLGELNPTPRPAASRLLEGVWDVVWTTEAELLYLTRNGLPGLPPRGASQAIRRTGGANSPLELENEVAFDGGALTVLSTCEPSSEGRRVDFRFVKCLAKAGALELLLPPVGSGWFEVLYIDDELRLCRDVRGDLQVCERRRSAM